MSFPTEIKARLVASGISDNLIAIGSGFDLPATGTYLSLIETGGTDPYRTHNTGATPSYHRPGMQVVARAELYDIARALAVQAFDALVLRDTDIEGVRYVYIEPVQQPFDLGLDSSKRSRVAFNIRVLKRPS